MQLINRVALIVRPKRRYVEWLNAHRDDLPEISFEEARSHTNAFLVGVDEDWEPQEIIDEYAEEIFEEQLALWDEDEDLWPANRSAHVFRDWFEVDVVNMVLDVDDDEPLVDDAEPLSVEEVESHCAWCHREIAEDEARIAFDLPWAGASEADLDPTQPLTWPLLKAERVVFGMPRGSADAGDAQVRFIVCSADCETELKDAVAEEQQTDE